MQVSRVSIFAVAVLSLPAFAAEPQVPGVANFHQVSDRVYRGAQPTEQGWKSLANLGVVTVIDLRREDEHSSKAEQQAVEAAGMHYVNVPMNGVVSPPPEKIAKVLALLNGPGPVFVHCKRGADRTGTVVACYRIAHDHWDSKRALSEAKSYGMSIFQVGMKSYVRSYQPGTVEAGNIAAPDAAVAR
jgi:uncharacterized protein (TIGR01244 family)